MAMKEDYVSYEQAKKLAEFDFDGVYRAYVVCKELKKPILLPLSQAYRWQEDNKEVEVYLAPTLHEAQKWLREVKKIDILVFNCACGYGWEISKAGDEQTRGTTIIPYDDCGEDEASGMWLSYEAALSAGISKTLEYLEK